MNGVESVRQLDDTHTRWKTRVDGVERDFDATITEQHPEERVAWRSADGTTQAGVVTVHKIDDDVTRVTVQLEWQPEGLLENADAVPAASQPQGAGLSRDARSGPQP